MQIHINLPLERKVIILLTLPKVRLGLKSNLKRDLVSTDRYSWVDKTKAISITAAMADAV